MTRYHHLADIIGERIEQGLYNRGQRLPSVRALSVEHGVSISTVQQAYRVLEHRQLITARPKSGYFVCQQHGLPALPEMCRPAQRPVEISQWELVLQLTRSARDVIHLGPGVPDVTATTLKPLRTLMSRVALHPDLRSMHYDELSVATNVKMIHQE